MGRLDLFDRLNLSILFREDLLDPMILLNLMDPLDLFQLDQYNPFGLSHPFDPFDPSHLWPLK